MVTKKLREDIKTFNRTGVLPKEERVYRKPGDVEGLDVDRFIEPQPSPAAVTLSDAWPDVLKAMPDARQRVYQLHMVGGLTQAEVAAILNVTQQAVSLHVNAIRDAARKVMAGDL